MSEGIEMNVLIAEDYEDTRMILQASLGSAGYAVSCAENGREALAMARREMPDIIISDILMPEMDGFEFCRAIKADETLRHIPFIFYTATYIDASDRELAMASGAARFIIKPMENSAFLEAVGEVLDEGGQQRLAPSDQLQKQADELEVMHERVLIRKLDEKVKALEEERRALKTSEQQLRTSLAEKEVLLRELHHRVKNNMQVLCSLTRLQAESVAGKKTVAIGDELNMSYQRIKAMALIHESMCLHDDLSSIDFADYVRELSTGLLESYGGVKEIRCRIEGKACRLHMDQAIPCGMIVNELITNCLKHAFPQGAGEITMVMAETADAMVEISVSDNGVGLPAALNWRAPASMGLDLVNILTGQLHGTIDQDNVQGACFRIRFSRPQP
ncbi:MAG: response regulator [Mariprofundaceae bacterium]|nr:response regulator [Mariprofundaceae bacterium]